MVDSEVVDAELLTSMLVDELYIERAAVPDKIFELNDESLVGIVLPCDAILLTEELGLIDGILLVEEIVLVWQEEVVDTSKDVLEVEVVELDVIDSTGRGLGKVFGLKSDEVDEDDEVGTSELVVVVGKKDEVLDISKLDVSVVLKEAEMLVREDRELGTSRLDVPGARERSELVTVDDDSEIGSSELETSVALEVEIKEE